MERILIPANPKLRPELTPLPRRMMLLPIDARGYPVPWFVAWINGQPDFRVITTEKWTKAVRERRCWVCGQVLGVWFAFTAGPMCGISRTTAEPPAHLDCAEWAARNCPFLARPHMRRREDEMTEALRGNDRGIPLPRNPGAVFVWSTKTYKVFGDPRGRPLIEMGPPEKVSWWSEGRPATRAEVEHSVETGFPALLKLAREQDAEQPHVQAEVILNRQRQALSVWYPEV